MPQEQQAIEKSYKRLKQAYDMPAYDEYVKSLETPEGRQKAYSRLSEEYEMPFDFQTFDSDVKKQLPRSAIGQFAEGFKRSNIGLAFEGVQAIPTGGVPIFAPIPRTKVPDAKEPNTFTQSLATQAGTLVGDFPAALLGSVLALPSKNPAAIAGASFAAPEAIRQAQLEFLEKGTDRPFFTTKDVSELAGRMVAMRNLQKVPEYNPESVVGSLLKAGVAGAKGFAIGAATAKAGQLAPAGFKTAAEIGTLATLPHAIEGELPSVQSVAEAAVLVGGLKLAARGAKQIAKVAKRRGQTVEEVVSEIKDEADPQKALDAIEKATDKTEKIPPPAGPPKPVKPTEPTPTTPPATSYSRQFNDAVETAKNTLLVTRGLDESVRKQRLQEALKDYDPLVADEILQPRRERGGAVSREERAEVSVEPSAERKSIVDAIAEASVQTSNWRTQLDAIKAELTKRLEASGLTEAQVPVGEGKTVPLSIKQQPKLSPEQQAIVQEAINLAAEEGGFSVEAIGRGLEIIATPEKLPTFDFSRMPIEQLVQMVEPVKAQLRTQLDNLKIAKVVGKDALTDYFFESKSRGERAAPLKGTTAAGETVSVKVNRARSASRPDVEPWKQYVEEIEARERKLASETEGTLVIGKPQERTVGNTLFTQESYEAALNRLREDANKLYDVGGAVGDLPRQIKDWIIVGGYHLESGFRDFKLWSNRMTEEFGDAVLAHLRDIWNTLHRIHAVGELKTASRLLDHVKLGKVARTSTGFEEVSTNKKELIGTKVLDKSGKPKRVFHGTTSVFQEFDPKFSDPAALYGRGFYFTDNPEMASKHPELRRTQKTVADPALNIKPAYLHIKKPLDVNEFYSLSDFKADYTFVDQQNGKVRVAKSADVLIELAGGRNELLGEEIIFLFESPQAPVKVKTRYGEFQNFAKANGFDGITFTGSSEQSWVAFDPKQIVYPDEFVKASLKTETFEKAFVSEQTQLYNSVLDFFSESIKGITELAGGKRLGIQPYSQANYNAALPHFRAAWKAYKTAGKKFNEFQKDMRNKFGQNVDLYLAQYRKEIDASDFVRILSEATLPNENFVQLDASLPSIWILSPEQSARTAGKGLINSTGRKAPVEVNLETPGIQDVTSFIIGSEGRALEVITRDVSHINRVRREAFAETANVSPKTIIDPGRPFLGAVTRKRFEKTDAEIVKAAKEYYLTGKSPKGVSKAVFNAAEEVELFLRLLDDYTTDYAKTLAQLGEKPAAVKKAVAKLTKLRTKALGGKNPKDFWNDLELYISAHAKTTTIDPVAKAVKRYINQAGERAFPENVKKLIYDQIIDAKGRVWLGDRMADSILQWFAQSKVAKKVGVNIEPSAKPFTRAVGGARSGQAKLKLGYRPIAAAINGVYAFYKPLVKADGPMMKAAQEARKFMNSPEGKTLLEEETYHGSLGISVATDTSGKPIPKESLLSPLGLWMAVEAPARRFNFSVSYLDALKRGMPEAAAKEFARRMVRLTNLTYVMSATPRIMRSPSARLVTQFKRFLSGEAEFMHTLSPREWARYALFQSLVVGPRGAIFFIKSIPVLAAIGILDEVEEQINKLGATASGIPGQLFGVDLGPSATLQLPTRPEDAYGVIISDAIKFYKEVYSPALNPELSAEGKLKNAAERLPEFAIAAKNWMDLVESNVNEDGWVLDSEGNRQYRLDSDYEKFLVGVLGATTLEKSRIQTAQSLAIREDKRKDEALRILSRRLRKEFALMGTISDSLIDDMIKVGVSDASAIENILESSKLPPEVRIALRARLKDRGKVFELFRE